MRILYLIDVRLRDGGAPISSHILAQEMAKKNKVYIVMPGYIDKECEVNNIKYIHLNDFQDRIPFEILHPIKFVKFIIELKKHIDMINPDIIHAQMPRSGRAVSILKQLGKIKSSIKLVFTDREYVIDLKKRYKIMYAQTIAKNYDLVVNLSESSTVFWGKYQKRGECVVIPNPGGNPFDKYSEFQNKLALKKYSVLSNDKLNILFVGRMTWEKRWDLAKEVIFELNKKYKKKINIIIVVAYSDVEQKKQIDKYVMDFKHMDNVYIFENLKTDKLDLLYYLADIHCITSCRESFGRTAIEAMSRRTLVISTDGGAIKETVGRKEFIVHDEPSEIVKFMGKYINDKELLEMEKDNFYNYYQRKYTTYLNYEKHYNLYKKLLNCK